MHWHIFPTADNGHLFPASSQTLGIHSNLASHFSLWCSIVIWNLRCVAWSYSEPPSTLNLVLGTMQIVPHLATCCLRLARPLSHRLTVWVTFTSLRGKICPPAALPARHARLCGHAFTRRREGDVRAGRGERGGVWVIIKLKWLAAFCSSHLLQHIDILVNNVRPWGCTSCTHMPEK